MRKPEPHLSARLKEIMVAVAELRTPQAKAEWVREKAKVVPRLRWFLGCLQTMELLTLSPALQLPTLTPLGQAWVDAQASWTIMRGTIAQKHPARERLERQRKFRTRLLQEQAQQT